MLLRADSVTKSFGSKAVIKSATVQMDRGSRIGLVGRNGAGKTSLLRILMGQLEPDTGELVHRTERIGYLPQFPKMDGARSVKDLVGAPYGRTARMLNRMSRIEEEMATPGEDTDWEGLASEYAALQEEFSRAGGHEAASKGRSALAKVGLDGAFYERKLNTLSGGELTKAMLARVVVQAEDADLLFLDEPTSHLDVGTVEWLEDHLSAFRGGVLVVSHDRYFLDRTCTSILELRNGTTALFHGNYSEYAEKRMMEDKKQRLAHERYVAEQERHRRIADELHRKNRFSSVHKTRLKMAERMDGVEAPVREKGVSMSIESAAKSGKNFVIAEGLTVRRGETVIVEDAKLDVMAGDKLGLFGPNGAGKSTLLKTFLGELEYAGSLWVAPGARCGYFSQTHDGLTGEKSAEEHLLDVLGKDEKLKARKMLAALLLKGEDVERPVSTLSGGERARVALAMLMSDRNNLLMLDEPTNYLDIPSRHAVESALAAYSGTVILVTHDRYLLDAVCNKVAELKDGVLAVFAGNYTRMKGEAKRSRRLEKANVFRVVSSFTDWTTRTKFKAGERITIAESEMGKYGWAIEAGKLKRVKGGEMKLVDE